MTQEEISADIQKQIDLGFSREEIQSNLETKGIPRSQAIGYIKNLPASVPSQQKRGMNSWLLLLMAILGFIKAGLRGSSGQKGWMAVSLILAVTWLCMFIYEQSKK
ncbi:MAG TPA: hypothetical protein VF476_11585 [Chitinophagaceae bacterium]